MLAVERLDVHVGLAAAAQAQTEDDVVVARGVVGDDARAEVGEKGPRALGEIALQAAAAERAERAAVFADHRARAGTAVRRAARGDDGDQDAALAAVDDGARRGDDAVEFEHRVRGLEV